MSQEQSGAETTSSDETKKVGRGALYLTITKMWFLVSSYVIVFFLSRLLGKEEVGVQRYGQYSVITGLASIINAFIVFGTQQAVSRFVGRDPESADGVRRAAYRLQAFIGGGVFVVMLLAAPIIAEKVYENPDYTTPIRFASLISLFYSFYAIFMGYLNGTKQFGKQALVDFSYATMKCVLILGFAAFLIEPLGVLEAPILGFAAASAFALALGWFLSGPARGAGQLSVGKLFQFQAFTMVFAGVSTMILQADLQVLKIFGPGGDEGEFLTGLYSAAQKFAQIPFQAVFAITFVLFPLVSGVAGRDPERLRGYVRETTRYAFLIASIICACFFACPERTLNILFRPEYMVAGSTLRWLLVGYLLYSPVYIMCAILNAAGRPSASVILVLTTVATQILCGYLLVDSYGILGVGAATAIGMTLAFLIANFFLRQSFGQCIVVSVYARILLAAGISGLIAHALLARSAAWGGSGPLALVGGTGIVSKLMTVAGFTAVGVVYLIIASMLGALTADDRSKFMKVIKRG